MTSITPQEDLKIITENKKHFDAIYALATSVIKLDLEEMKKKYTEITGEQAPDTTRDWLKEAIVRKIQNKYYSDNNIEIPDTIIRNNEHFFSGTLPKVGSSDKGEKTKRENREKKERTVSEREDDLNMDKTLIAWKESAALEPVVKKCKKEYKKFIVKTINEAGKNGILLKDLAEKTEKMVGNTTFWGTANPKSHFRYLVKCFGESLEFKT